MNERERAAMQQALGALEHKRSCAYKRIDQNQSECTCGVEEALTALREALAEPDMNLSCKSVQARLATSWGYVKADQAEQEPVAKTALKNCIYFDSIDFNQTPPYLRYDTGDSTPKENWTIYCDIQEDLRKNGYELTDSDVDHDTVCGYVTPIEAPVRTKDLTDDEVMQTYTNFNLNELGEQSFMIGFARAVIAAYKEKNKD